MKMSLKLVFFNLLIMTSVLGVWSDTYAENLCSNDPSLKCIKSFVSKNITYPRDAKDNWMLAEKLAESGLYDESLVIVKDTIQHQGAETNGLLDVALMEIVALKIASSANLYPNKVADFSLIDDLGDTHTDIGQLVPEISRGLIKVHAYSHLAFKLIGQVGEGGDESFVRFHEREALSRFKPNRTWHEFIKKWIAEADNLQEPLKSGMFVNISERLLDVGDLEGARNLLARAKNPSSGYDVSYMLLLIKLGDFDKAIKFGQTNFDKTVYYRAYIKKAENLILNHKRDAALNVLIELEGLLKNAKYALGVNENLLSLIDLYRQAGAKERATAVADWIFDRAKRKEINLSLSQETLSKAYRLAGDNKRSIEILRKIVSSSSGCSVISDQKNGDYALEFYKLGLVGEAKEQISKICDQVTYINSWINLYRVSFDTEFEKVGIKEIMENTLEAYHSYIYASVSAFHFLRGEADMGNMMLDKAIVAMAFAKTTSVSCQIATIAHYSNKKLPDNFMAEEILIANSDPEIPSPRRRGGFRDELLNTLFGSAKSNVNDIGFYRYNQYLDIAKCYHQLSFAK